MGRRRAETDAALVLRRFRYGESSLVVHLLTRRHGRVPLLAKGAYRPKSGFFGVLDLFDTLEVGWRGGGGSGLGALSEASISRRRRGPTRDLERYRAALSVLELAGLGAREGEPDPGLFDLTCDVLDLLDAGACPPPLALVVFDLRFLAAMGLAPALEGCASCGRRVADADPPRRAGAGAPFSMRAGGRLCEDCVALEGNVSRQPLQRLRIARSLMQAPLDTLPRVRIEDEALRGVAELVTAFLEYHLETRPRTRNPRRPRPRRPRRPRHDRETPARP